jgi:capreomycidine synthase
MKLPTFVLEDWFREHYFDVEIVLCDSGVQPYTVGEVRRMAGVSTEELDAVVLGDSQPEGGSELRNAIGERWRNGDASGVLVAHGSTEAMFLVMNALLSPGDEVVAVSPGYQPLRSIPEAIGCRMKHWVLRPENGFHPDVDELKKLITPSTKMVTLNFPNNPTGATLTAEEYRAVVDITASSGAYLIWDTAFRELSYDAAPLPDPGLEYERAIVLGTVTKTYGIGGLRVGWCLTTADIVSRCVDIRGYTTVNCSPLTEYIAARVVRNLDKFLPGRLSQARLNRDLLGAWVAERPHVLDWTRPDGGVSAFVKLGGVQDMDGFCRRFATSRRVFLLPGTCFGFPEYVRIGFGGPAEVLRQGLSRLSEFLDEQLSAPPRRVASQLADSANS